MINCRKENSDRIIGRLTVRKSPSIIDYSARKPSATNQGPPLTVGAEALQNFSFKSSRIRFLAQPCPLGLAKKPHLSSGSNYSFCEDAEASR